MLDVLIVAGILTVSFDPANVFTSAVAPFLEALRREEGGIHYSRGTIIDHSDVIHVVILRIVNCARAFTLPTFHQNSKQVLQ